jgi:hypothetical protein
MRTGFVIPWIAVLLTFGALPLAAAAQDAPARLTLLTPCGGAVPTAEEERLRAELELALDGFDVVVVDPGRADFQALPEQEQIDAIREATSNASDTSPVLWLECGVEEQIAVRLMITDGGVPLVRVLGGTSFEEIALIVRELIGAQPPPPDEPASPAERAPVEDPPPAESPTSEEPPVIAFGILTGVELGGGLVGHVGASFLGGIGVGVDMRLALGFFGRVTLLGKFGPRSEEGEFLIVGQRVEPRIELGYLWGIGDFSLGPLVGLAPFVSFIDFAMDQGHHQRVSWWSVRYSGGVDSRWRLTERLTIVLDLTLGFMPGKRFYRRSTSATLYETPTMDLACMLAVVVRI